KPSHNEGRFKARSPHMRGQFAGTLLLGDCRFIGAVRRISLTAAVIGPMRRFVHALTGDCLRLPARNNRPMPLVSAMPRPALFRRTAASQGGPSRGDGAAPHAETSGVLSGLVALVGI